MALDTGALSGAIKSNLEDAGFVAVSQNKILCDAIAKAVVEHIQASADVEVTSGDSAGTYKVS